LLVLFKRKELGNELINLENGHLKGLLFLDLYEELNNKTEEKRKTRFLAAPTRKISKKVRKTEWRIPLQNERLEAELQERAK